MYGVDYCQYKADHFNNIVVLEQRAVVLGEQAKYIPRKCTRRHCKEIFKAGEIWLAVETECVIPDEHQ